MEYLESLRLDISRIIKAKFDLDIKPESLLINETRSEFEGDYTLVVFPLVKQLKKAPLEIGNSIGSVLIESNSLVTKFNVVKGFLNMSFKESFWNEALQYIMLNPNFGRSDRKSRKVLVEFSSPNTNKPLHLGHIRNILLGWSCSMILEEAGYDVVKTQIINDRGIAICKSIVAYEQFGNGETPNSAGIKGDFLVGKYYVEFEKAFQVEYKTWQNSEDGRKIMDEMIADHQSEAEFFKSFKNEYFNIYSTLGRTAKDTLLKWEDGDTQIISKWKEMNSWVYAGFEETYKKLGVYFDQNYYESDTYKLGKENILEGLSKGIFYQLEDESVWIDLEDVGMDKKLVLRSDGTSVYMTQDIGTAQMRYDQHRVEKMVYVVGDEQDYHFKALFAILKKMQEPYSDGLYHLSYGMVDLPSGRMKSREGTVVDADDLIDEVILEAKESASERGELDGLTEQEKEDIYQRIGLGALKFYILKVNPKKRMVFNPTESLDMQGQTGPYIQNAFVRIQSVLRKNEKKLADSLALSYSDIQDEEKLLIQMMLNFPAVISEAAEKLDPSSMANYCYALAKAYHKFYHELRILSAETKEAIAFRLSLSASVAYVLEKGMKLLGIKMPQRM